MSVFAFNRFVGAYEFIKYSYYYFNNWFSAFIDYLRGCYFINVKFRDGPQFYLDSLFMRS